jgi:hypothetical protein
MPKLLRKEWLLWAVVALMFAGMLWGIIAIQMSDLRQFRSEGVEASAIVVDKFTTRSSSTDSSDRNFAVTYMAGGDNDEPGIIDVGTFSRASFTVGGQTYNDTEIGDTVAIYYLPDDTSEAELKSWVDTYDPIIMRVLVWLLGGTAVFCLIAAIFAPKTRDAVQPEA